MPNLKLEIWDVGNVKFRFALGVPLCDYFEEFGGPILSGFITIWSQPFYPFWNGRPYVYSDPI